MAKKKGRTPGSNDLDIDVKVDTLVKMRLNKMASTQTLLDYCKEVWGYGTTYSYDLIKMARTKIAQIYQNNHIAALEEAILELEEMREREKVNKNSKLVLEITKELNKLKGFDSQKLDITSGGDKLPNEIIVKIIGRDE